MNTAKTITAHLQPTTVEDLLAHEEALAIQRIANSVQGLGEDLCVATGLREKIRRHPLIATGLGAFLGFVGGPFVPRAFKRMLTMTQSLPIPAGLRPQALPGLVLSSLRGVRARM